MMGTPSLAIRALIGERARCLTGLIRCGTAAGCFVGQSATRYGASRPADCPTALPGPGPTGVGRMMTVLRHHYVGLQNDYMCFMKMNNLAPHLYQIITIIIR